MTRACPPFRQSEAVLQEVAHSVARLERASAETRQRVDSLAAQRRRPRLTVARVLLFAFLAWFVLIVLQATGLVDLGDPLRGSGTSPATDSVGGAGTPAAATLTQGGGATQRAGQAAPTPTTTRTPGTSAPAPVPVSAAPTFIANTGDDGMGPGGTGVGHYRACVPDDHFLVSDTRWPDGTAVKVVEIGNDECFGWLLVDIDGERSWVRDEYLVTVMGDDPSPPYGSASPVLHQSDATLQLAVFTDSDANRHWLFVEVHEERLPRLHLTGSRGMAGTSWGSVSGHNDGLSYAMLDSYGRILHTASIAPRDTLAKRADGAIAGVAHTVVYTRFGWFAERGIVAGSYVEMLDLPLHASHDGRPQ